MKTVYVATYRFQEAADILGVFANRADAEEWCLEVYKEDAFYVFTEFLEFDSVAEAMKASKRFVRSNWYNVEEYTMFD